MRTRTFPIKSVRKLTPVYKGRPRSTIIVAGRSNVGKSTLINAILQKKVAPTSKTPGRTRAVYRYLVNERYDLVDLPGYGYAKVSEGLRLGWRDKVGAFMSGHGNIQRLLVLVDCRRGIGGMDLELIEWAEHEEIPVTVVITKADKLGKGRRLEIEKKVREHLNAEITVFTVSATAKIGIANLAKEMIEWWRQGE